MMEREGRSDTPSFCWGAGVFNYSGYARLSRELLSAVAARGARIQLDSYGTDDRFMAEMNHDRAAVLFWNALLDNEVPDGTYFCFHPPVNWEGRDLFQRNISKNNGFDTYVGVTMFETDRLPAGWAEACNRMDEVWVPSSFNMETFARAGVDRQRLRLVQPGIDVRRFATPTQPVAIPDAGFAFLSVFQWSLRKGWDVLLAAWFEAFTRADDVLLVIRAYPGYREEPPLEQRIEEFTRSRGLRPEEAPRIHLLKEFVSEERLPALYQAADAYVLPTRGEGWGLPFMEAMATGLPTIGTRWSAQLDFMDDGNSYLIDLDDVSAVSPEMTLDDPYYTSDQQWAQPSMEHTADLMRRVYEQREEARERGRQAQKQMMDGWSPEHAASRFLAELTRCRAAAASRGFRTNVKTAAPT